MKMLVFAVQFSRGSCRPWRPATAWLVHPVMGEPTEAVACGPMAPTLTYEHADRWDRTIEDERSWRSLKTG